MDPFEELLFPPPDKAESARMFIKLKTAGQPMRSEEDKLMAECIKQAAAESPAIARIKTAFASIKKADDASTEVNGPSMAPPNPPLGPDMQQYMTSEQEGREIEEQRAVEFYSQKLRESAEQMGLLKEELEAVHAENDSAQEQLATVQQTIQTTQQEGQLAQQAAIQNSQQANVAAQQAMAQTQQAMADATQAKLNLQEMRARLLEIAGQDPGIAGMGAPGMVPGAGQAIPGGTPAPMQDPAMAAAGGGAPPQDPAAQQQQQAAPVEQPAPEQPAPQGGSVEGGGPPSPSGDAQNGSKVQVKVGNEVSEDPNALSDFSSQELHQLRGVHTIPSGLGALAGGIGGGLLGVNAGQKLMQMRPGPQTMGRTLKYGLPAGIIGGLAGRAVGRKIGQEAEPQAELQEIDRLLQAKATANELGKTAAHPALIGGLLGAAGGAGLAGMEALGHGPDLDAQRQRINTLEQGTHESGMKGFGKAFELAKEKALLTLSEATREHPVAATLAGGVLGASLGASAGPQVAKGLGEAASFYRGAAG